VAALAANPSGALGQIVKRNQKLNDWLRDMVGDEAVTQNDPKTTKQNHPQPPVQVNP
jgi:hypothetical protein